MDKKRTFLSLALLLLLIMTGCNDASQPENIKPQAPAPKMDNSKKGLSLSYEQYRDLFNNMSQKLQLAQFSFLESTKGSNIVAIDKDWSFGSRSMLTLEGKPSDTETQERIIYKKKDGTLLLIDLIYLKDILSNDLIFWPTQETEANKTEDVLKSFDEAMLSYKNVIVKITIISKTQKTNLSDVQSTLKTVTTFMKKY